MPIEDIQYLYENSTKESIVLLIDSNKRNKDTWRNPSEFEIDFPEPFKNVYGVEVLNASIPRTTFTVDKHNRSLRICTRNTTYSIDFVDFNATVNDYNSGEKLISGLTSELSSEIESTLTMTANSEISEADNNIASKGYLKMTSGYSAFVIDVRNSTLSKTLGFTLTPMLSEEGYLTKNQFFELESKLFLMNIADANVLADTALHEETVYENVLVDADFKCTISIENKKINCGLLIHGITIDGAVVSDTNSILESTLIKDEVKMTLDANVFKPNNTYTIKLSYYYLMDSSKKYEDVPFRSFFASEKVNDIRKIDFPQPLSSKLVIDEDVFISRFKLRINDQIVDDTEKHIYVLLEGTTDSKNKYFIQCRYFKTASGYFIEYDVQNTNPFNFTKIKMDSYTLKYVKYATASSYEVIEVVSVVKSSSDMYADIEFKIVPPGVLNMITENYVLLRCPEIENHIRGSYDVNDASPGLALFNIDESGYVRTDTEFYSVVYKEFHPIGKLSKLHFKFERKTDGQLVDFKGVDVHFILSVKMYNPKKLDPGKMVHELNPNYNPDYLGFMDTEFDNIESDEEREEQKINEDHYDTERQLLQLRSNRNSFRNFEESEESEEFDDDASDDDENSGDDSE
jgi:hypothetical protein